VSAAARIRAAVEADFPAILRLNDESVRFLSALTPSRLALLHAQSAYHRVAVVSGEVAAFLLAFREASAYDSPNYRWFADRHARFLYVDRVVVDAARQQRGLGDLLYADLLAFAREAQVPRVTCEIDVEPPNPVSARFHARFGFREVGRQQYGEHRKTVSLQELPLGSA
jgi:predicted GNAT superfamily acetyltransferase